MAKQGQHQGEHVDDFEHDHVGFTAQELQQAMHSPIRGRNLGGSTGAMLERIQNGGWTDQLAIVGELFNAKDMDEIFAAPAAAAQILQFVPMFKAIKGIPEIAAKGPDITAKDVSTRVLSSIHGRD